MQLPNDKPSELRVEYLPLADLLPYARNARTHSDEQVAQIAASIREFGFANPILISEDADIIAGHGRALAAYKLQLEQVPCIRLGHLSETQRKAYVIADNRLALNAGWNTSMLSLELLDLQAAEFDLNLLGFEADELKELLGTDVASGGGPGGTRGALAARFGVPPFSVLDARQGYWRERKDAWTAIGMRSEVGRAQVQAALASARHAQTQGAPEDWVTTSIFDPVLCELAYRWFSPVGGIILDPFAGGSVRGIVAALTGREYVGVDLRLEQVAENRQQAVELCPAPGPMPVWHCGDSRNIERVFGAPAFQADFIFSCPPYADLEVYSDDPRDISTLGYDEFLAAYREIIAATVRLLRPNRFACFVVGDIRCSAGFYRNFVGDTVAAFKEAGADYYNEAIFVTPIGTLPVRAGRQFLASRKLGKTHQNVLVFCKGNPKTATQACGVPDFGEAIGEEA